MGEGGFFCCALSAAGEGKFYGYLSLPLGKLASCLPTVWEKVGCMCTPLWGRGGGRVLWLLPAEKRKIEKKIKTKNKRKKIEKDKR